jgi:signal transduction histidine kinase
MIKREEELEQRTHKLEEELRQTWIGKERELSERAHSSGEKEQAAFQDKMREFQTQSQDQIARLQTERDEFQRNKKEWEQLKAEQAARFEQRDRTLREREDQARDEAGRQLSQLESDKGSWMEKIQQLEADQTDIQKRQTQLHAREAEIDRLREQLTASLDTPGSGKAPAGVQSLVEEWVFGFAHQVRNPLGIIRSMSESMMQAKLSYRAQKESFAAILQAVDGLSRRLGEFIDFSKPVKVSPRSTVLAQVADGALGLVQSRATEQSVQINRRFDEKTPILSLDPDQLQTALHHLLTNALEAMPHGGTLNLDVRPDSNGAVIRIHDTGSGISAAHMKEIGKPFFTTKTGRIGLGLAGAKRILHSLGGELTFDSKAGQGTTAICRFKLRGK